MTDHSDALIVIVLRVQLVTLLKGGWKAITRPFTTLQLEPKLPFLLDLRLANGTFMKLAKLVILTKLRDFTVGEKISRVLAQKLSRPCVLLLRLDMAMFASTSSITGLTLFVIDVMQDPHGIQSLE